MSINNKYTKKERIIAMEISALQTSLYVWKLKIKKAEQRIVRLKKVLGGKYKERKKKKYGIGVVYVI